MSTRRSRLRPGQRHRDNGDTISRRVIRHMNDDTYAVLGFPRSCRCSQCRPTRPYRPRRSTHAPTPPPGKAERTIKRTLITLGILTLAVPLTFWLFAVTMLILSIWLDSFLGIPLT